MHSQNYNNFCPCCSENESISSNPYSLCDVCTELFNTEYELDILRETEYSVSDLNGKENNPNKFGK